MAQPAFSTPPPKTQYCILSFPAPYVLLVTLNRPKELNCINTAGHIELDQVFTWLDREPALRVAIITGNGRAFCAGADLKGKNLPPCTQTPDTANLLANHPVVVYCRMGSEQLERHSAFQRLRIRLRRAFPPLRPQTRNCCR